MRAGFTGVYYETEYITKYFRRSTYAIQLNGAISSQSQSHHVSPSFTEASNITYLVIKAGSPIGRDL